MDQHVPATYPVAVGGSPRFWIATVCVAIAAAAAFDIFVDPAQGPAVLPVENGPIELLQVVLLVGCIVALIVTFVRSASSDIAAFSLILAYVLFHATVRELPRCDSAYYEGGPCFPFEWKDWARLAATALALLAALLKRISWRATNWTRDRSWMVPSAAIVAVLAAGQVASRLVYVGLEEVLELAGYISLMVLCLNVLMRELARGAASRRRPGPG